MDHRGYCTPPLGRGRAEGAGEGLRSLRGTNPFTQFASQIDLSPQGRGEGYQASFTASVLKSLPSASNTFLTMFLASSPARAYIAFGVSWSRNTSGRIIERRRSAPLSRMP